MVKRTLLGAAGALVGVVAANRFLRRSAEEMPPLDAGTERTFRWRGMDIAYAEDGDESDPDVLFVHEPGIAASGHEFADAFTALSEEYHVVAPDLPGYGRSDRPPLQYSSQLYESFLADFGRALTDEPTVVAAGLSGAYATRIADEIDAERLVLVAPTTEMTGKKRPWRRALLRTPVVGTTLFNAAASGPALRRRLRSDRNPDDDVEYQWLSAHQPGARYAPAAMIGGELHPDADITDALAELACPVTLIWGRMAKQPPLSEGRELADHADAELLVVEGAGDRPHVETPDAFVDALHRSLPRTEGQ